MKSIDWHLDHYGILSKLLFNESTVKNTEGVMRMLGFVHLYTASGIHLYALLDAIERVAQKIIRFLGLRTFWVKRLALYGGMVLLAYLWSLQEYRIGFARPILIFLIRMWVREKGMKWRLFYPLSITYGLDAIFQIESGRLHYYLAVGGGLLGMDWMKKQKKGLLAEHAMMSLGSWFFTALVDLITHHTVAWMTPVWSMITIPIISLFLYPLTIACWLVFQNIPDFVVGLWNGLIDVCVSIIDLGFTFSIITPTAIWASVVFAILLMWVLSRLRSFEWKTGWIFASLAGAAFLQFNDDRLIQFDVKQGDSMAVIRQGRVEFVDVGSSKALRPDQWMLKLASQGIDRIDVILLSHLDEDHIGGLKNMVAYVSIGAIQTHRLHWQTDKGKLWARRIRDRSSVQLTDQNHLQLMKLDWFQSTSSRADGNGFMAGVVVPLDQNRAYLGLGDGDESQEAQYVREYRDEIHRYPFKIWKAGHHGSKHSSGTEEMFALAPSRVWVSVGKKNSYHHPSVEAMQRLQSLRVRIQRTDEAGDLVEKISQSFFDKITG